MDGAGLLCCWMLLELLGAAFTPWKAFPGKSTLGFDFSGLGWARRLPLNPSFVVLTQHPAVLVPLLRRPGMKSRNPGRGSREAAQPGTAAAERSLCKVAEPVSKFSPGSRGVQLGAGNAGPARWQKIHGIKGSGLALQLGCCIIVGGARVGPCRYSGNCCRARQPAGDLVFNRENSSVPGAWGEQRIQGLFPAGCRLGGSFVAR